MQAPKFHLFRLNDCIVLSFNNAFGQGMVDILGSVDLEKHEYAMYGQLRGIVDGLPAAEKTEEKAA